MLADQAQYCLLVADIVALAATEESAVRADASLAVRQADQLLHRVVLRTEPNGSLHLLLLLLLNFGFCGRKPVLEVDRISIGRHLSPLLRGILY